MRGFAIIVGFNFVGYLLQTILIPLPASVIGLILLAIALFAGWIELAWIEEAASLLLKNMVLFFTPILVGVMTVCKDYTDQLLPIGISLIGSTLAVLIVSGWTVEKLNKRNSKQEEKL